MDSLCNARLSLPATRALESSRSLKVASDLSSRGSKRRLNLAEVFQATVAAEVGEALAFPSIDWSSDDEEPTVGVKGSDYGTKRNPEILNLSFNNPSTIIELDSSMPRKRPCLVRSKAFQSNLELFPSALEEKNSSNHLWFIGEKRCTLASRTSFSLGHGDPMERPKRNISLTTKEHSLFDTILRAKQSTICLLCIDSEACFLCKSAPASL